MRTGAGGGAWAVERRVGSADAFHHLDWPDPVRRTAWVLRVDRPALVLGSTQDRSIVDHDAAAADGVDIVRRGSGGGAVLLVPGEAAWVDVIVPGHDRLWVDDVARAFAWLSACWRRALAEAGIDATVHVGRPVPSRWSDLVCFAGLGSGELHVAGAKLVGMSQRRTRRGARFQCAIHRRWDPSRLASLLALTDEERADLTSELEGAVAPVPDPEAVVDALLADLPT